MKPLTILFDADDTSENLVDCWIAMLNERYGTSVTLEDITQWDITAAFPALTKEQVFSVIQTDELWHRLSPQPGAQRILKKLMEEGHKLYMVTASDYRVCKTKFDCILKLFPFLDASQIIITSNKQMIKGDVLIDDAPHNLIGGDYLPILYDRPHNRSFDNASHDIPRVYSWDEIYNVINQYKKRRNCYGCN